MPCWLSKVGPAKKKPSEQFRTLGRKTPISSQFICSACEAGQEPGTAGIQTAGRSDWPESHYVFRCEQDVKITLLSQKMDRLSIFNPPISIGDVRAIEGVLRDQDMVCTSFPDEDVYSVALYYSQAQIHGAQVCMVLDRNVFARIVELAKGRSATPDHRIAAAVMAFGQCADINFEPALAVYEGVATQAENDAPHDLAMFRAAVNVHPSEFADIALARSSSLHSELVPAEVEAKLISTQLTRQYLFVYPPVLRMGLIELEGGPMADRMRRFLDWTYSSWYMSAPATVLANMCFSGSPPRDALKNLRNRDRSLALKGLRNCAWDLTYVTWWGELLKQQNHENCLYLFCSHDKALRRVAQQMLVEPDLADEDIAQALRQLIGTAVYDHYAQLVARQADLGRAVNRVGSSAVALGRQIAAELEQQLQRPV